MTHRVCIHCYVTGKVQGVWFRASTKDEAEKLGITGWARNLADGRVEILACGEKDKIAILSDWLKQGPPLANVIDFSTEELPWQEYRGFDVL
jgi:acylphosphatase